MSDYIPGVRIRSKEELRKEADDFLNDHPVVIPASPMALRHNEGKPRPALVPVEWEEALMDAMEKNTKKYPPDNWKKGGPYNTPVNSLMRHLMAFRKGEELDPSDGVRHLVKVAVNALILDYWTQKRIGVDDR